MSYVPYPRNTESGKTIDASTRVTLNNTLFDGKTLDADNTLKWDTKGTGTQTFTNNTFVLNVTSGQYFIRQSRTYTPYFPGKSQRIEVTSFNFEHQAGITKRAGYFSSTGVAPYATSLDGAWLESDGTTRRLICANNGTVTHNIPESSWDNAAAVAGYDWSKFTVFCIEFLWLGGAGVNLFVVINGAFVLVHTIKNHTGTATIPIFSSPQQPLRYEVRSASGSGTFTPVCSQISSEGSGAEQGQNVTAYNVSVVTNAVGTNYLICGVRKNPAFRGASVVLERFSLGIAGATNDSGMLFLCLNPTYSAPPTWTDDSKVQTTDTDGITVTNLGKILQAVPLVSDAATQQSPQAALRTLGISIDNIPSEIALVYQPTTSNQTVSGSITLLEF
jgi:hypothetical protein